jgi:hypothetical protein
MSASYHRMLAGQARVALRGAAGDAGIGPDLRRHCDDYAQDVLGWRGYAPWLYVYAAVSGTFKPGWIPDNYYGHIVVPRIKGWYGNLSNRKALTSLLFATDAFPDLAYRVNGMTYGRAGELIDDRVLRNVLFSDREAVVYKAEGSSQGRSVLVLRASDFDERTLTRLGDGVFQAYVRQHPSFDAFASSSVATIRLTTAIGSSGVPTLRACYVRFPRHADTHVRSASAVRVAVDRGSGCLDDGGYLPSWRQVDRHPDSGEPFSGATVPQFDACVATVVALHRRVPFVRAIGWDAIVDDENRVRIFEWNGEHNDVKFSEATQGPCFADLGWERLWKVPAPSSGEWIATFRRGVC